MIPLYFKNSYRKSILWGQYDVKHRSFASLHQYYLTKKKTEFLNIKTDKLINTQPISTRLPDGFIFHAGRTGSTLLVRILKAVKNVEVFSEIDLITQLLSSKNEYSKKDLSILIRNIISAYVDCTSEKTKCFIKFTSTDTLELSLLMKLYPEVPVIYLYDSPVRILSSQLLRPPRWAFGCIHLATKYGYKIQRNPLIAERIKAQSFILNKSFKNVYEKTNKTTMMTFTYQDLFTKKLAKLFKHLNLKLNAGDLNKVDAVKLIDAKNPSQKFSKINRERSTPTLLSMHLYRPKALDSNYQRLKNL